MQSKFWALVLISIFLATNLTLLNATEEKAKIESITCPVSGKVVNKAEAVGPYKYQEQDYYFCCAGCLEKFKAEPEKFLKAATKPVRTDSTKTECCQQHQSTEKSACCKSAEKKAGCCANKAQSESKKEDKK